MKNGRYEEYGEVRWYEDGVLHRFDGPAIETPNGTTSWWAYGALHRLDGPAVEYPDGCKAWYVDGICHRLDGPAVEYSDGSKAWYVDGQEVDIFAIFGYEPPSPLTEGEQLILRLSI